MNIDPTPLLDEYLNQHDQEPTDPAKQILFAVMGNILDRRGFDNEWDGIDPDIQEELLQTNLALIKKNLP